jgi:hypothetical protein
MGKNGTGRDNTGLGNDLGIALRGRGVNLVARSLAPKKGALKRKVRSRDYDFKIHSRGYKSAKEGAFAVGKIISTKALNPLT